VKTRIAYLVLVVSPVSDFRCWQGKSFFGVQKRVPSRQNIALIQLLEDDFSKSADSGIEGE